MNSVFFFISLFMLSPSFYTRPNIVYNSPIPAHTHASCYRQSAGAALVSVARWCRLLPVTHTNNERTFYIRNNTQTIFICGQQPTSGNLVTSISTQNGHKGSSSQGDGTIASPARRSEVSPIQYHVSIRKMGERFIDIYLFFSVCVWEFVCWHIFVFIYLCDCALCMCCKSAIRLGCEMWIRYFYLFGIFGRFALFAIWT